MGLVAARRLFEAAPRPEELAWLAPQEIDRLIGDTTFHEAKAAQIHSIAQQTIETYGGKLPCDVEVLRAFRGVGPKCAHLALGIACGETPISVDVHVDCIVNRWGYVRTNSPEQTMAKLERRLPHRFWVEINALLVPFGKHIGTGSLPRCSTCPVLDMCRQVGVTTHR